MERKRNTIKRRLERLYRTFDRSFLSTDPLEFVHRYTAARNREIAGLISSSLAYGRVAGIRGSVGKVLSIMGKSPYGLTMAFRPGRHGGAFSGFSHRFTPGSDRSRLV